MFREIRRKKQALTAAECEEILREGTSGVLAVAGDDNYPYAVPINYIHCDNHLYFHCAKSGHRLDAIARNEKASFCVINQGVIVPEEYTAHYKSVIVFGKMRVLEDDAEKRAAMEKLTLKFTPDDDATNRQKQIDRQWKALCVLEMSIEHISGKKH